MGSTEEEKVDAGHELQNLWICSREQGAVQNPVRFTGGQTHSASIYKERDGES
jgi:hypothetical protein